MGDFVTARSWSKVIVQEDTIESRLSNAEGMKP